MPGAFGITHWIIIAIIVFLFFGNRLPSVMRSLGEGVVEFKKGLQGIENDVKNAGSGKQIDNQTAKTQSSEEVGQAQR